MKARLSFNWRAELPVLAALFLDLTAFGMVFPDVQLHAHALGASGPVIGLLLASMFVVQLFASPPWGALSDRIGRKPVFVLCTAFSAISWIIYGHSTNLWLILASRILAGIAAANVVVGQAYLADISSSEERSAAMSRAGAAISCGLILGPALGLKVADMHGIGFLGFLAGGLSATAALFGLLMATPPKRKEASTDRFNLNFAILKNNPQLRSLVLLATVAWFALATLEGTFGRLITEHYRLPETIFGDIFSMESLLGFLIQAFVVAWIVRRLHETWTLRAGFLLVGVGLLLTPFAPAIWLLFVFSGLYAIGSAFANPTLNASASKLTSETKQGELFGLLQGARSVGFLVGPAIGGALFDWRPAAPYLLAGSVGLLTSLLVPSLKATGSS